MTSWRQENKVKKGPQAELGYKITGLVTRTAEGKISNLVDARQDESLDAHTTETHIRRFFSARPEVALAVIPKLLSLKEWLWGQSDFYFYGTSLLFAYDAAKHGDGDCDVRWINFSNAVHVSELFHDSSAYDLCWSDPETHQSVRETPRQVNSPIVEALDRILNICRSVAWNVEGCVEPSHTIGLVSI
eukprot:Selendium_serpulae@DN6069_c0_g1_i9.p1